MARKRQHSLKLLKLLQAIFREIVLLVVLKEMSVKGSFLFLFSNWYIAEREESMEQEPAALPVISMSAG